MANQYINEVIYGGNVLISLKEDTVQPTDVISGKKFHMADGSTTTGTNTWDSNTQDATALDSEILLGKTAYVNKNKLTGTMPNNGAQTGTISTADGSVSIRQGYHNGSGKITIDPTEQAKLIPANIRKDIVVLGITGTMSGEEDVSATTMTVTPTTSAKSYTPPEGSNYFSQFTVEAIPYAESDNAQGGKTVTIASN